MKGTDMDAFGVSKRDGKKKTYEPSSGKPSGSRRVAHYLVPGPHTLATSRPGHRMGNLASNSVAGAAGGAAGTAMTAGGLGLAVNALRQEAGGIGNIPNMSREAAMRVSQSGRGKASTALVLAGIPTAFVGSKIGQQMNLGRMNRKGTLKKEVHKSNTVSAFGVDHNEEISKLSFKPVTQGFKALKFGNAKTLPKTMGQSYKSGIATGQGKFNSAVNAAAVGVKHSPGIAGAGAGLGAAGIGGTGYAFGRRKD